MRLTSKCIGDHQAPRGCGSIAGGVQEIATLIHIFLHHGVTPNPNMTRAMGLDHVWNDGQLTWHVATLTNSAKARFPMSPSPGTVQRLSGRMGRNMLGGWLR